MKKTILLAPCTIIMVSTQGMDNFVLQIPHSGWVQEVESSKHVGCFVARDRNGIEVVIDGEKLSANSAIVATCLQALSSMYAEVMSVQNISFVRSHPWMLLMPTLWLLLGAMLLHGRSYRDVLHDCYIENIEEIYASTYQGTAYLVVVRDPLQKGADALLGSVMFVINDIDAYGDVQLWHLIIKASAQERDLSKILMASIFNFLPQTKRILLNVNRGHAKTIASYESAGFKKFNENWYNVQYEYIAGQCSTLQNIASGLRNIENSKDFYEDIFY